MSNTPTPPPAASDAEREFLLGLHGYGPQAINAIEALPLDIGRLRAHTRQAVSQAVGALEAERDTYLAAFKLLEQKIENCLKALDEADIDTAHFPDFVGDWTVAVRIGLLAKQREHAQDRVFSLEGVINAVDRVLWSQGAIHASRAVALVKLISAYDVGKGIIAKAALDDLKSPPNSPKKI